MKSLQDWKSIVKTVFMFLAVSMFSFTLTSCGDDGDEDADMILLNGEQVAISSVSVFHDEGRGYDIYFNYGTGNEIAVSLGEDKVGKRLDLTKNQTSRDDEDNALWYCGVGILGNWFYTDEGDFQSGTMQVNIKGNKVAVVARGQVVGKTSKETAPRKVAVGEAALLSSATFSIVYEGPFTEFMPISK